MKKTDDNKNHFEKKNLVKLAPAVVVIAAVAAAAGARNMDAKTSQTADEKSIVQSIEVENWLKTAYTYEEEDEDEILKSNGNKSSSSKKKKSKTTLKTGGIKKGSAKTLPVKSAEDRKSVGRERV